MTRRFRPSPLSHARVNEGETTFDANAAFQAASSVLSAGIGLGVQARQAKLQRQHEESMAEQQSKLYALQSRSASAQARLTSAQAALARGQTLKFTLIGGAVLVGMGFIALALRGRKD